MKLAVTLILGIVLFSFGLYAQDSAKIKNTNPIIYTEVELGYAPKKRTNLLFGASISYQLQKSLLTVRSTALTHFLGHDLYQEHGVLFGRRFIKEGSSLSYSLGVSWNRTDLYYDEYSAVLTKNVFFGVPFEFNIKWFDGKKEKYRILGIFPVGKPFAFGTSEGFKIQGNISKNSYVALGVVFGFGFHKHY